MRINQKIEGLVKNGLTKEEAKQLPDKIQGRTLRTTLEQLASPQFDRALKTGAGDVLAKIADGLPGNKKLVFGNTAPLPQSLAGILNSAQVVSQGAKGQSVQGLQRGLMTLGYLDPRWGADGSFGRGTKKLIEQFQGAHGLEKSGEFDKATKDEILEQLKEIEKIDAVQDPSKVLSPANVVAAAEYLMEVDGAEYGTRSDWRCRDPHHRMWSNNRPVKKDQNGNPYQAIRMAGSGWKCNLAVNTALYCAGFEPPRYPDTMRYPLAREVYRFTKGVQGAGKPELHNFEMVAQATDLGDLNREERRQAIADALNNAEPGDIVTVQHKGDEAADGGHCRLVMSVGKDPKYPRSREGTVNFFQARADALHVVSEGPGDLDNEVHLWVLRPRLPRTDGKQLNINGEANA